MRSLSTFSSQSTFPSEEHNAGQTMEIGMFAIFVSFWDSRTNSSYIVVIATVIAVCLVQACRTVLKTAWDDLTEEELFPPLGWRRAQWKWARAMCSWRSGNNAGYGWSQLFQRHWLNIVTEGTGGWPFIQVDICRQLSGSTGGVSPWVH